MRTWWIWQTRQLEVLVPGNGREGSTPFVRTTDT